MHKKHTLAAVQLQQTMDWALTKHYIFYDIEPENHEIIKQDYLLYDDYHEIKKMYNKIHVVGNPPFGRQSSLVIKFIKKSCEFSESISFILPRSFKKDSLKRGLPLALLRCKNSIPESTVCESVNILLTNQIIASDFANRSPKQPPLSKVCKIVFSV